jgi:hypothetical protein
MERSFVGKENMSNVKSNKIKYTVENNILRCNLAFGRRITRSTTEARARRAD